MTRARWGLWAPIVTIGLWAGMATIWTHGLSAFTNFSAARVAAGPLPRQAPPLEVVDQTGRRWDVAASAPEHRLVQVMYLRCPGVCTIAMSRLGQLTRELADLMPDRLRAISLSVDHDAPEALHEMWLAHDAAPAWSLASLTAPDVGPTLERLGVFMFRRRDGVINHGVDIMLLAPDGRVVRVFSPDDEVSTTAAAVRSALR